MSDTATPSPGTPDSSSQLVAKCPGAERYAIEVLVVDDADQPVRDVLLSLTDGDRETTARTATGLVRFEGLKKKSYRLTTPEWDESACFAVGDRELPENRQKGSSEPAWRTANEAPQPPETHTVEEGESLDALAVRFGFDSESVWNLEDNEPLRKSRRAMYVRKGEILHIPRRKPREIAVEACRFYYLRISVIPWNMKLRFVYEDGSPRATEPFVVLPQKGGDAGELIRGETDGDGVLSADVPFDVDLLEVTIGKEGSQEVYNLVLRGYEPVDESHGAQMRLSALGFYSGIIDGELGPMSEEAIAAFQEDFSLEITGELDDATRGRLEEAFGS